MRFNPYIRYTFTPGGISPPLALVLPGSALFVTLSLTLALAAFPRTVHAQIFDATADYSRFNNPNGVWSAGYTDTLGSALNLYNINNGVTNGLNLWNSTVVNTASAPTFGRNLGGAMQFGIPPGQIMLHPGPQNQYSVLRFTAPVTTSYSLVGRFFSGDSGDTDATILLNSNTATPVFFAVTTGTNPTFNEALSLTAGNTVDFVVGSKGSFISDTTPLIVQITVVAAPEPATVALLATGLLPIAAVLIRRRHSHKSAGQSTALTHRVALQSGA